MDKAKIGDQNKSFLYKKAPIERNWSGCSDARFVRPPGLWHNIGGDLWPDLEGSLWLLRQAVLLIPVRFLEILDGQLSIAVEIHPFPTENDLNIYTNL